MGMNAKTFSIILKSVLISILTVTTTTAQTPDASKPAAASNVVKITSLGQRTGELCARDRAFLFEDPTGIRILYDPGVTVSGGGDPRLGAVDAILVSHSHFDHIGYRKLTQNPDDPAATCSDQPKTILTANTTAAEVAAVKNSAVLVNGSMAQFLSRKIGNLLGIALGAQPCLPVHITGRGPDETVVPPGLPCTVGLAFGSSRIVTRAVGTPGVRINMVSALHSDSLFNPLLFSGQSQIPLNPLTDPPETLGLQMNSNLLTGYDGLANGFVLTFTNGLRVYLTGDTGPTSDMALVVRELYRPNLAVANVDGFNTMGPEEAAYAMTRLVHVAAVIPSHAEQAVTMNGQLISDTRIAEFIRLLGDTPAFLPLSGQTMYFNGNAQCIAGCGQSNGRDMD
jgi:L-ascorbate metabolism protein UlaG (beta-lactamase superfamily)